MNNLIHFLFANWFLTGLALVFLLAFIMLSLNDASISADGLSSQEATLQMNRKNALLIDLRSPEEYKLGHILNATLYDFAELKQSPEKLGKNKERPIIVYCKNGNHSSQAVKWIKLQGFSQVGFIKGGIKQWQKDNLPISKPI